jgi:hypothetical protein
MNNRLYRHRKKLDLAAVLLLCFSITFTIDGLKPKWLWSNYSLGVLTLVILILVCLSASVRLKMARVDDWIKEIEQSKSKKPAKSRFNLLSNRQKLMYDLILLKESGGEIMNELSIDLNTLLVDLGKIKEVLQADDREDAVTGPIA